MAIQFKNLKTPRLGLTDTITFGKLNGCRVCDVAQDHYEYLIWAERNNYVKFQPEVIELIQEQASFAAWQTHQAEEIDPYTKEYDEPSRQELDFSDDVPF